MEKKACTMTTKRMAGTLGRLSLEVPSMEEATWASDVFSFSPTLFDCFFGGDTIERPATGKIAVGENPEIPSAHKDLDELLVTNPLEAPEFSGSVDSPSFFSATASSSSA